MKKITKRKQFDFQICTHVKTLTPHVNVSALGKIEKTEKSSIVDENDEDGGCVGRRTEKKRSPAHPQSKLTVERLLPRYKYNC